VVRVYVAGPPFAEEYRRRASALLLDAGVEPVDPMRRDFRGRTEGNEQEIVNGDLDDIASCDAVLADFTRPDEGTAMEAWHAHGLGKPVIVYTGGTPPHPWTVFVAESVHADLESAVAALSGQPPESYASDQNSRET
jgi:nucleoside 2-deoxyribosyltransferase